jgi:uncharacterized protein YdaU (DUF1376 family)
MVGLTLEERGAYVTILNLIYARGGPVPEDEWWITSQLACTKRAWLKLRAALILKGKLFAVSVNGAPSLMNERAADEIAQREEISESCSVRGVLGGHNSGVARRKNNSLAKQELQSCEAKPKRLQSTDTDTEEPTTIDARDWRRMLTEAAEAAGDAADLTRPAMHHAADLKALIEPSTGEPCTWPEVLDAIAMTAMRQRAKRKPITTWAWVQSDAWALRDKRLNAAAPAVAEASPLRATGPPSSLTDRIAADNAESERRAFEMLDASHGRTN